MPRFCFICVLLGIGGTLALTLAEETFPDTVKSALYVASVRVKQDEEKGSVAEFKETFDPVGDQGRIQFQELQNGSLVTISFLYFRENEQRFTTTDRDHLCKSYEPSFLTGFLKDSGYYGLRALFTKKDLQPLPEEAAVDGDKLSAYRDADNTTIYYFKSRIPVTVKVKQDGKSYTVDILSFYEHTDFPDNRTLFQIPEGRGCKGDGRSNETSPDLERTTVDIRVKLTYVKGNVTMATMINLFSEVSGRHTSCISAPWQVPTTPKGRISKETFPTVILSDDKTGVKTTITKEGTNCLTEKGGNEVDCLMLPDGNAFPVELFLLTGFYPRKNESLGEAELDRSVVQVFEITEEDFLLQDGSTVTAYITSYYLKKSSLSREIPVRVEARFFANATSDNPQLQYSVFSDFQKRQGYPGPLPDLNDRIHLDRCERDTTKDEFIKITFPVNSTKDSELLSESICQTKRKFRDQFIDITKLSSLRVPTIQVDIIDETMYITAQLLPIFSPTVYFEPQESQGISDSSEARVISLDECLKSCLSEECQYAAYCSGSCSTTKQKDAARTEDGACTLYTRNNKSSAMVPTLNQALQNLQAAIDTEQLRIRIDKHDTTVEVVAKKFDRIDGPTVSQKVKQIHSVLFPSTVETTDYKATVQIKDETSSTVFKEYFSPKRDAARIEYLDDQGNAEFPARFLYFRQNGQRFTTSDRNLRCESSTPGVLVDKLEDGGYFGIRALFKWRNLTSSGNFDVIRGSPVVLFSDPENNVTYYYNISGISAETKESVNLQPVRAEYRLNGSLITVDVLSFRPQESLCDCFFQIPAGRGCAGDNSTSATAPDLEQTTVDIVAEVLYVADNVTETTTFEMFSEVSGRHTGCKNTPWTIRYPEVQPAYIPPDMFLSDDKANIGTLIPENGTNCRTEKELPVHCLSLSDGSDFSVSDFVSPGFHPRKNVSLGRTVYEGTPVDVFEITQENQKLSDGSNVTAFVTLYLLTNDSGEEEHTRRIPVRVEARFIKTQDRDDAQTVFSVYTNLKRAHGLPGPLPDLRERVSLAKCDRDTSTDRMVQVTFPVKNEEDAELLSSSISEVQSKFLGEFTNVTKLSPLRVLSTEVSFDEEAMAINAHLLEIFAPSAHFETVPKKGLRGAKSLGKITLDQCLRNCLTNDCEAVAYCGETCTTSGNKVAKEVYGSTCTLYKRDNESSSWIPTLDKALTYLQTAIDNKELKMIIAPNNDSNATVEVTAENFDTLPGHAGKISRH